MADESQKFIQLRKNDILKIGIKDAEGNDTGEHLEFDLQDIELPLKLNRCEIEHRKNLKYLKDQSIILEKQEDKKGKFLLSWKQEEQMKLIKEFYHREMDALDLFLGKGGTKKLLNGRSPYYEMYEDIAEIIQPILPLLKQNSEDITKKIQDKYKNTKEKNVLE